MSAIDTINITNLIDSRPISKYQASVFFLCALAALMDGFDSVIIGITAPAIAKTLELDVKTFGPVFSPLSSASCSGRSSRDRWPTALVENRS